MWEKIYYSLGMEFLHDPKATKPYIEEWFKSQHIVINLDADGRWQDVDIPDEDLPLILLRVRRFK
jgi:hypothetical protein